MFDFLEPGDYSFSAPRRPQRYRM